jgi:hypothetical protein
MKTTRVLLAVLIFLIAIPTASSRASSVVQLFPNHLVNGGFEEDRDLDTVPDGWEVQGRAKLVKGALGGKAFRLSGTAERPNTFVRQTLEIPSAAPSVVTVAALVKAKSISSINDDVDGKARATVRFLDKTGAQVGKVHDIVKWRRWDGTFGWFPWSWHMRIPDEAKSLELKFEIKDAVGAVLFDDVRLLWGFPDAYDRTNLIVDGGLEFYNTFSPWDLHKKKARVVYPGFESRASLLLEPRGSNVASATQRFVITQSERVKRAEFRLRIKLKKVKPLKKGGGAHLFIEYFSDEGELLDTASIKVLLGTTSWKELRKPINIPKSAKSAILHLTLRDCSGKAQFDDIRLTTYSGNTALERRIESRNDTSHWRPFASDETLATGALDSSHLLDAPAGKHGFLSVGKDGHFYFEDGVRGRFVGVNIQGAQALPTHQQAEAYAEWLARLGFNLVRFHHLDAPWAKPNIFDARFDDTQHLSTESLDRLDYFISELKRRGIYVYLDLLVSRKFKKGDQVPGYVRISRGAKGVAQFNRRLIELQKNYARQLLTHLNPYTGTRYVDEPTIVLTEIINESSLLRMNKRIRLLPSTYLEELHVLWERFLKENDVQDASERKEGFLDFSDSGTKRFYAGLQRDYFQEMHDFLRELGLRIPIAGSNLGLDGWDLETNSALDFIDRHAYWDHPRGGYGDLVKFNNVMMTSEVEPRHLESEPKRINPILKLSHLRVKGKPFVVGEWNVNWPNEYRALGPALMTAYALFQDWDAIIQFNFEGHLVPSLIQGNFDVSSKPEIFLQFPAINRLFHERHVTPAQGWSRYPIFSKGDVPLSRALRDGIERVTEGERELVVNDAIGVRQTARINTDRTQAAIGNVGDHPVELGGMRLKIETLFATVILTSLDEIPIRDSEHLLLTTVARSENQDTVYNSIRTLLRSSGTGPILLEPVIGSAFLATGKRSAAKVFALTANGERINEIETLQGANLLEIPLGGASLYEIVFEGGRVIE